MRKHLLFTTFGLVFLFASAAEAASIVEGPVSSTAPSSFPLPGLASGVFSILVDRFDGSLGTLTSIEIDHNWSGFFSLGLTQPSNEFTTFTLEFTNSISTSGGDALFASSDSETRGASGNFGFSVSYENVLAPAVTIIDSAILALFTGAGTITLSQELTGQITSQTGVGTVSAAVQAAWGDSTTITYNFTPGAPSPVPVPAAVWLFLSAASALGFTARRKTR